MIEKRKSKNKRTFLKTLMNNKNIALLNIIIKKMYDNNISSSKRNLDQQLTNYRRWCVILAWKKMAVHLMPLPAAKILQFQSLIELNKIF